MSTGEHEERFTLAETAAVWREVDGETVVLDLQHAEYLGINSSGSALWRALGGGATLRDLTALLVAEFGAEEERARADALAFVSACRQRGLLR